jgi:hypothetical protein
MTNWLRPLNILGKKMAINKITLYRVEVKVPDKVWNTFKDTPEYAMEISKAIKDNVSAGSDSYSTAFEWAEFHNYQMALICNGKLQRVMSHFQARLPLNDAD